MAKTRVILDKRVKLRNGKYPIKIYIYHGAQFYMPLGLSALPEEWDIAAGKYRAKDSIKKAANVRISSILAKIDNILLNLEMRGDLQNMSANQLKTHLSSACGFGVQPKQTLSYYLVKGAIGKSLRTQRLFKWCDDKVREFTGDTLIKNINKQWVDDFRTNLQRNGLAVNSITLLLAYVSRACSLALMDGAISANPLTGYKKPHQETRKRSLTIEEMRELRDMSLSGSRAFARDIFFLSFYLIGINIADLAELRTITAGRIEYSRKKTGTLYSVKVPAEAIEIIERYRGHQTLIDTSRFASSASMCSVITNLLKKLRPGLSTYYARHSWATFAAELDIPIETISHALGHKIGSPVTAIYIAYNQRKIDEANRRVIDYLNSDKL